MNEQHAFRCILLLLAAFGIFAIVVVHAFRVLAPVRCTIVTLNGEEVAACK